MRSLIAAVALLAFLPDARQHWSWRNGTVGFVYAVTLVLFVTANKLTTAANAIFLQATAPLYILLAAPFVLPRARPARRRAVHARRGLQDGGVLRGKRHAPRTARRIRPPATSSAAASGVTYAVTVMGLRGMAPHRAARHANTVVSGNLVAAAVCLPAGWPIAGALPADWVALAWLGVFQIGLAYVCLSKGVSAVTALEASLLLLAEPVLNPVWAWLAQGERPGAVGARGRRAHRGCDDGAGGEGSQSALNRSHSVTIVSAAWR